jgi:hypothetical protein
LKKGDLGGFKNLQVERIYGKRYKCFPKRGRPTGSPLQEPVLLL